MDCHQLQYKLTTNPEIFWTRGSAVRKFENFAEFFYENRLTMRLDVNFVNILYLMVNGTTENHIFQVIYKLLLKPFFTSLKNLPWISNQKFNLFLAKILVFNIL